MTVINTLMYPPPTVPGSVLVKGLPAEMGVAREDALYYLYKAGQYPMWLRRWVEFNVKEGNDTGTFYVLPDFLCVGTDDDYVYTPMGALGAERVLSKVMSAMLPTHKMVEIIYGSSIKQVAQPWGPPYDATMTSTSRWAVQTERVRKKMQNNYDLPGGVVEGHFKNVIVSERVMARDGVDLGFFGWYKSDGKPIQLDSLAHGACYCDYSHGVRAVLDIVVVNGNFMPLKDALCSPKAWKLFSHSILRCATYEEARHRKESSTGVTLPLKY